MTREIPLTRGMVAIVDDEDYEALVAAGRWQAVPGGRTFYARRTVQRDGHCRAIFMHAVVAGFPRPDHINGDGLDNRRSNLRPATLTEQARNRRRRVDNKSGFKGVSLHAGGRWVASIRAEGRFVYLGLHDTREGAARAYDNAALTHFGDFARLNFPREQAS